MRVLTALAVASFVAPLHAQSASTSWLPEWLATPIAPGHEMEQVSRLAAALPGWSHDALGTWSVTRGSGEPRRVVACALDRRTYVVSQITDDGYLRVHDPAGRKPHPLWDNFHEGQRVVVLTHTARVAGRALPGVFAVRSTHLARGRGADTLAVTADDLWLDVGARTRAEATALGIQLLDPVARDVVPQIYGVALVAMPAIASGAACRAVVEASRAAPTRGTTTFALAAQSTFGWAGLSALLSRAPAVDSLTIVGPAPDSAGARVVARFPVGHAPRAVAWVDARARFPNTLVETMSATDAAMLTDAVSTAAGVAPGMRVDAVRPSTSRVPTMASTTVPNDAHSARAALLAKLADVYAVSSHEARMRDAVLAELPAWARRIATVDTAGNIVVAVGPEREPNVFVAHIDEIGFEITSIARDGTVALRTRGGGYLSLWEGQPALLHLDDAPASSDIPGVFVPRAGRGPHVPRELTAWFGLDSAALVAKGATVGLSVTGVKHATRLASTRFTARSLDDRSGTTALILAMRAIDPSKLTRRIVFAFSTREEIGLIGASALGSEIAGVERVYAVDTFVSSDSPIESQRFAFTPLGAGAVARALDNSSATPPAEIARVLRVAAASRVSVQVGTTNGGNDGSELVRTGAIDVPLSWPGRYSHSPVETLDLRDLDALARLIAALATSRD